MLLAPVVLKQKGTPLTESVRDSSPVFGLLIRVKVTDGRQIATVASTVIGGTPKIIEVKGMSLRGGVSSARAVPQQYAMEPGFVGTSRRSLGERRDQHRPFHMGREAPRWGCDRDRERRSGGAGRPLAQLRALPQVLRYAKVLGF